VLGGAAVVALSILATPGISVQAVDYDFVSIYSGSTALTEFDATVPSVNSGGAVAFAALVDDPAGTGRSHVVFRSAGGQLVALLNLTEALGPGSPGPLMINDPGTVALHYARGADAVIVRIQADGSWNVLARSGPVSSARYLEMSPAIALNRADQVAALVTNPDLTSSIVRLGDDGATEIARSSAKLGGFGSPALNDAGVVAFTAQAAVSNGVLVYSGTGGPLTDEGDLDRCRRPSQPPVINNDGMVLSDCGGLPVVAAHGGVVSALLTGNEDPIFGRLVSGYGLNNRGRVVFVTGSTGPQTEVGLFTGNDAASAKVVRSGDVIFGLPVERIRSGPRAINDTGQITFLLQVGGARPTSHVILATPRRLLRDVLFPDVASTPGRDRSPRYLAAAASAFLKSASVSP